MKYKLIKEYPGSPELGTEVEKDKISKSYFYRCVDKMRVVLNDHVENNPEYWKEINEYLWYVVSTRDYQESNMLFQEWFIYTIETCLPNNNGVLHYFKTKKEAEEFIEDNKPCLSYSDLIWRFPQNTKKNRLEIDIDELLKLIKSKL